MLRRNGCPCDSAEVDDSVLVSGGDSEIILFATKTCPKCKVAASMLDKAGIAYSKLYVEDNEDKAREIGLRQAPTLVYGGKLYPEIAGVREFIDGLSK